jgi:phosphoglycerate dehydrogenase-like enzyme
VLPGAAARGEEADDAPALVSVGKEEEEYDMASSRRKVLVTEPEYRKAEASFLSAPGFECLRAPEAEGDLASAIRDARASYVVVGPRTYSGALYDALPKGGVIARFGVGHDGIDKTRATAAGLFCTNTPGVLDQSVAEHTMLLVAAAARMLTGLSAGMARGAWEPAIGAELQGKTLAIIGCGGIGRSVARIASLGYGMQVVGCSRPGVPPPAQLEHFHAVTNDFTIAVRHADFVSLHMTASRDNVHFMNRDRLAHLGERTWLINTARGSIVDEGALFEALAGGRLAGAALDVFAREPYAPAEGSGDVRSLANVILTPHVGSNTAEANRRIAERALQNIALAESRAFARMDLLNPEVLR